MLISWSDKYKTGCEKIDYQHKGLFDLLNEVFDSYKNKEHKGAEQIIEKLFRYAEEHFKTEEELFKNSSYPWKEKHIAEHEDFVRKIEYFKSQKEKGNVVLDMEILYFLKQWISNHILNTDLHYTEFVCNEATTDKS